MNAGRTMIVLLIIVGLVGSVLGNLAFYSRLLYLGLVLAVGARLWVTIVARSLRLTRRPEYWRASVGDIFKEQYEIHNGSRLRGGWVELYNEMPIPAGAQVAAGMKEMMKGVQVKQESLGSEQVGGYHCDKTRMTVTWQGVTGTTIEWTAKELNGFVVKKQDETTGELTEYKNIRLGPQDPSLFELPAGYKKMSM